MKKYLYLIVLLITCSLNTVSAQHHMNREQFRLKQKAFLTEKANLTPEEAKQLFPLYFELQNKKQQLNRKAWQLLRKGHQEELSESEYSTIVDDVLEIRIATDKLELEYIQKYKKFLSAKKIYKLQRAEMHFHRSLLKDIQNMRSKRNKMNCGQK